MIYFSADLHLDHANILTYCERPFSSIEEMNTTIIDNINGLVKEDDTFVILGDFSLRNERQIKDLRKQIKCQNVILIQGNHDKSSCRNAFNWVIFGAPKMKMAGQTVLLSHFPYRPHFLQRYWVFIKMLLRGKWHFKLVKHYRKRPVNKGLWLLHGHTHQKDAVRGRSINVGVDAWDFRPVSLRQIEAIINREKQNSLKKQ